MIRLVVIDLDGTLLNAEHQISDFTKQTLRALQQTGTEVMVATGRHFQDVSRLVQPLEIPVGLITSNGARVHNPAGELLYENHIPQALAEQVLAISENFAVHRNVYQGNAWLVEEENLPLLAIHQASGFEYQQVDFANWALCDVDKFYFNAEHRKLEPLENALREALDDQLYITFTTEIYLEVMNKGVSKGIALSNLCQQKGLNAEQVMAFGDGLNDVDMLQWVGHPVLMANAHPKLKSSLPSANVALSNAENGVAHYLQQFFAERL